ncbi:MAG: hypothetical protein Q9220_006312 [cf. Caloplaca sp. 1 TL-2023]
MATLPVKTASAADSIWAGLGEDNFRRNVVDLANACGSVPEDPMIQSRTELLLNRRNSDDSERILSLKDEERVAEDFAYLAAAEEGVGTVTAVALEEQSEPPSLTIRLAANAPVLKQTLEKVNAILNILQTCISESRCVPSIFDHVVQLNRTRIHGRLRSRHWIAPAFRGPDRDPSLHQALLALIPKMDRDPYYRRFIGHVKALSSSYRLVDEDFANDAQEIQVLQQALRKSDELQFISEISASDPGWSANGPTSRLNEVTWNLDRYTVLSPLLGSSVSANSNDEPQYLNAANDTPLKAHIAAQWEEQSEKGESPSSRGQGLSSQGGHADIPISTNSGIPSPGSAVGNQIAALQTEQATPRDISAAGTGASQSTLSQDQHEVTPEDPFDVKISGMHLFFEMEYPGSGIVSLSKSKDGPPRAIDVAAIELGETLDLYRDEAQGQFSLTLYANHHTPVVVVLEWPVV